MNIRQFVHAMHIRLKLHLCLSHVVTIAVLLKGWVVTHCKYYMAHSPLWVSNGTTVP